MQRISIVILLYHHHKYIDLDIFSDRPTVVDLYIGTKTESQSV
jgi:hypothetical protein